MCFTVLASPVQPFVLLGSRYLWVTPHPLRSSAFLSWPLGDSLCFVREPASLGPPLLCALLSRLLWDRIFFLLGSRILRGPTNPLCASAFLFWLLWDSFFLLGTRLLWVPPPYCVIYCPGFSGTPFCSVRVPDSLGPSPTLVCFGFSVLASLGQLLFC